jgi:ribokinase
VIDMTVVVFGSINIDLVVQVPRLPTRGETVIGERFFTAAGGKAANQAVAAAKLGVSTKLIGQVGRDHFGQILLESLQASGVNIENAIVNPDIHSGVASITVDRNGENTIACAAGANYWIGEEDVNRFVASLPQAKVAILDLGIPMSAVLAAAREAHHSGCLLILDPAPARNNLPAELYSLVDIFTPNRIEASQLVGFTVDGTTTARQAANFLHQMGAKTIIITMGEKGAFCSTPDDSFSVPAIRTRAIDTVAAGDAFNGALAAALASGKTLREAVQWGTIAGSLAVTKSGAQASLPDKASFLEALHRYEMNS